MLYIEKRLQEDVSEFGNTILVYSILRRTRDTVLQSQSQLMSWTPNARAEKRTAEYASNPTEESWPPATSLLSKWRNSACDSLDVIHWRANSKAAAQAGWEHSTILHLHLARLLLLTPHAHIQTLASGSSAYRGPTNPAGMQKYANARRHVLSWATHDQYKARLSIIHAGALLWHVRRYSVDVPIEPFGIYLATLVIWAYSTALQAIGQARGSERAAAAVQRGSAGVSTNRTAGSNGRVMTRSAIASMSLASGQGGQSTLLGPPHSLAPREAGAEDDEPDPPFVLLDRPIDDEMVQTFVRRGDRMAGHLLRVGDIREAAAPNKIIQEGIRLLLADANDEASTASAMPNGPKQSIADNTALPVSGASCAELAYGKALQGLLDGLRRIGGE
jgi:hypothetical protein